MRKSTITLILLFFVITRASLAQSVRLAQGQDLPIRQSEKRELVEALRVRIDENFYNRTGVKALNDFLTKLEKSDEYTAQDKTQSFSRYLTLALRDFTNDPHFNVLYSPRMFQQAKSFEQSAPPTRQGRQEANPQNDPDKLKNFFMPKLEVLEGNVGYFRVNRMANIVNAKKTVDAAMQFLAYTDALILDLRGNRGGVGGFTPYLASYFFPAEEKLLFSREFPAYDSVSHFYTQEQLASPRMETQDAYILIDRFTGSAARNLAYTIQQHGRAALVGEATGVGSAGGHSAGLFALTEGFIATVPIANVVHPISKSNWSMVGVLPDHEASGEEALAAGHLLALTKLWQRADGERKEELKAFMEELNSNVASDEVTEVGDLSSYVGAYELRKVFVENGKLYLQREGAPGLELKWLEKDLFQLMLPPNSRSATVLPKVKFERGAGTEITELTFVKADGTIEGRAKKLD